MTSTYIHYKFYTYISSNLNGDVTCKSSDSDDYIAVAHLYTNAAEWFGK